MSTTELKENDRVKRKEGRGGHGVILALREEVAGRPSDSKKADAKRSQTALMIEVLWDTGTRSYLGAEALERI